MSVEIRRIEKFEFKDEKMNLFQTLVGAYQAQNYPNEKDPETQHARYCYGRMSKLEFVLFHFYIFLNVFGLLLAFLTYFTFVPLVAQYKIDQIGTNHMPVSIHKIVLGEIKENQINFGAEVRADALFFIPLKAGINPTTLHVIINDQTIANVELPKLEFWTNQELQLAVNGTIFLDQAQVENTKALVEKLSNPDGFGVSFRGELKAPILAFGMEIYHALPLYKKFEIESASVAVKTIAKLFKTKISENIKFVSPNIKEDIIKAKKIAVDFIESDSFELFGTSIIWNKLDFLMDDASFTMSLGMSFFNPTNLELAMIEGVEIYLEVEGVKTLKISIIGIALQPHFNQLDMSLKITFLDENIHPENVQNAIESCTSTDCSFALVGPVHIVNAEPISKMTEKLRIGGRLSDLKEFLPDSSEVNTLLSKIPSILGQSKISIELLVKQIVAEMALNLPSLDSIKPPKKVTFPYYTQVDIYGSNETKAISVQVSPINITTLETKGFTIDVHTEIVPINTPQAAENLAISINPIVAANPSNSSVGIKDFAFYPPGGPHFKWCDQVFGQKVLKFGLPALNKSFLIEASAGLISGLSNDLSKIIAVNQIKIEQLNDKPGFGLDGNVKVDYPVGAPQLTIDLGYFSTAPTVESSPLLNFQLPKGIQFKPTDQVVAFNGAGVIERNDKIVPKIQQLADALLKDGAPPSYVGFTSLFYGELSTSNVVTFSKLAVDFDSETIKLLFNKLVGSINITTDMITSLIPPGMLKVVGADLNVVSTTSVIVKAQSAFKNPIPATISIGKLALDTNVNQKRFSGFSIDPISIIPGPSPMNIGIGLQPSTGANGLAQLASTLVNDLLAFNPESQLVLGISGLTLTPPARVNDQAIIDQFKGVQVEMVAGKIFSYIKSLKEKLPALDLVSPNSPIDISALLPGSDILSKIVPKIQSIKAATEPNAALAAGLSATYTNPLPLSLLASFVQVSIGLANQPFVDASMEGLNIARNAGVLKLNSKLAFHNSNEMPDTVASLVNDFLQGKLSTKITIASFFFGTSSSDRNDLFSLLNADVSSLVSPLAQFGPKIAETLKSIIPASIQHFDRRQQQSANSFISLDLPFGVRTQIGSIDLQFNKNKEIASVIGGLLTSPFPIDINIPFLDASADLDGLKSFTLSSGIVAKEANPLKLRATVGVNDVEELADKFAAITSALLEEKKLPGNVVAGRLMMGVSAQDRITAFSKLGATLALDDVVSPLLKNTHLPSIDFQSLGISVSNAELEAKAAKTLSTGFGLKFNNPFRISIKGLNFVSSEAGINKNPLVNFESPGIGNLVSGSNDLSVKANLIFNSLEASRKAVADFATDLSRNFGNTKAKFTISKTLFGADRKNAFRFLGKSAVAIQSSTLINSKTVEFFKSQILKSGITASSLVGAIKPRSVDVKFHPNDKIDSKLDVDLSLPFAAKVLMPFFRIGNNLDSFELMNLAVYGLRLGTSDSKSLNLGARIQLLDSNEVEEAVENVVATASKDLNNVPGTIGMRSISFGLDESPANVIDTFSLIKLDISINSLIGLAIPVVNHLASSINIKDLIGKLNPSLKDISAETKPGKILSVNAIAGFTFPFPITIQGLGYIAGGGGLDQNRVLSLSSGFGMSPGSNNVNLNAQLTFPKVAGTPEVVAKYLNDIISNPDTAKQTIFIEGAKFGFDERNAFKTFSKVKIVIPSSSLVDKSAISTAMSLVGNIDLNSILNNIAISKAHISADRQTGDILGAIAASVSNLELKVKAMFGFVKLSTLLNQNRLLDFTIQNPISLQTTNNKLSLEVDSRIGFSNDDGIVNAVASLAKKITDGTIDRADDTTGAAFIVFGSDSNPENIIDTFSKIQASVALAPFVPTIKNVAPKLINSLTSTNGILSKLNINMKNADLDVFDEDTLSIKAEGSYTFADMDFLLDMPFARLGLGMNNDNLADAVLKDLKISNGIFSALLLPTVQTKPATIQRIFDILRDIILNIKFKSVDTIGFSNIQFGASESRNVQTVSKVSGSFGVGPAIEQFAQGKPLEINDINATLVHGGIDATVLLAPKLPWLRISAQITGLLKTQVDEKRPAAVLCSAKITTLKLPLIKALCAPVSGQNGTGGTTDALGLVVKPILHFQDFGVFLKAGYFTLTGTNGKIFKKLDQAYLKAKDMVLFNPMVLNLVPKFPKIRAELSFKNNGPIHLDLGNINARVKSGSTSIVDVTSQGNVVFKNKNEGASTRSINQGKFDASLPPGALINMVLGLFKGSELSIEIIVKRDGKVLKWVTDLLQNVLKSHFHVVIGAAVPLLKNIQIKFLGIGGVASSLLSSARNFEKGMSGDADGPNNPAGGAAARLKKRRRNNNSLSVIHEKYQSIQAEKSRP